MPMAPVHIGTRDPRKPMDRIARDNMMLCIILSFVAGMTIWFSLQDRSAGELMTMAAIAIGF